MSKETLKSLIELVPEKDVDTLFKVVVKFIEEVPPELDEIEAVREARTDRQINGTVSHNDINWD